MLGATSNPTAETERIPAMTSTDKPTDEKQVEVQLEEQTAAKQEKEQVAVQVEEQTADKKEQEQVDVVEIDQQSIAKANVDETKLVGRPARRASSIAKANVDDPKLIGSTSNSVAGVPAVKLHAGEHRALLVEFLSLTRDVSVAGARESISLSPNDQTAVRFLRARDWKLDRAVKMYREAVEFAVEYELAAKCKLWKARYENPETEEQQLFKNHWMVFMFGSDMHGLPVTVIRNGCADIAGLVKLVGHEGFISNYFWRTEEIFEAAYAKGVGHLGCMEVSDLRSGGVRGWTSRAWKSMDVYKVLAKYNEKLYPERIRRLQIIGAPWAFGAIWKLVTPLVHKATREKIHIYSDGTKQQKAWMETLMNEMHVGTIPEILGGTGTNDEVLYGGYIAGAKKKK